MKLFLYTISFKFYSAKKKKKGYIYVYMRVCEWYRSLSSEIVLH